MSMRALAAVRGYAHQIRRNVQTGDQTTHAMRTVDRLGIDVHDVRSKVSFYLEWKRVIRIDAARLGSRGDIGFHVFRRDVVPARFGPVAGLGASPEDDPASNGGGES